MGFFSIFKKNKMRNQTDYLEELRFQKVNGKLNVFNENDLTEKVLDLPDTEQLKQETAQDQIEVNSFKQKRLYVENCCNRIEEANRRLNELKVEYQAVNAYLSDIQIIEGLPKQQKEELISYAKKVVVLEKDRRDFGKSMSKLNNRQYAHIRECEQDLPNILESIAEDEKYCETVKGDMRYLESEKTGAKFSIKDMNERILLVKMAATIGIISFSILMFLLIVLNYGYGKDTSILIYIVVLIAAIFGTAAFVIYTNAVNELQVSKMRLNKAIVLLNKIKIRYVNVVGRLEYSYEKHGVKSAYQLNKMWNIYLQLKQQHQIYNKASNRLIEAEDGLIKLLKQFNIKDCNIWISQAYAIVDPREMEEIKRSLNLRRLKLKSSLDYNSDVIVQATSEVKEIILSDKEHARELMAIFDANC